MNNAELLAKIKAEIERRKAYQKQMYERRLPDGRPNYDWAESLAIMGELEELLSFLYTLEESEKCDGCNNVKGCVTCINGDQWAHYEESERPINQNDELNDEIKRFVAEYGYERGNDIILIAIVARHFYELGKQSGSSEKPMNQEGLEKEIERFFKDEGWDEYWKWGERPYELMFGKTVIKFASNFYDLGCHRTAEKYDEIEYNRQRAEESEKQMVQSEDVFKIWGTTEKEYLAKSMDKVRLEMEIATYLKDWEEDEEIGLHLSTDNGCIPIELEDVRDLARHFAEWQKEQMLKKAVEGTIICQNLNRYILVPGLDESLIYGDKVKLIIINGDGKSD